MEANFSLVLVIWAFASGFRISSIWDDIQKFIVISILA